ncbi:MAG: hypothetical protein KDD51_13340, partial [Bdellovibrionales bacterium]|nr:hypothetical protein [Bdellovibrionales bacterium]
HRPRNCEIIVGRSSLPRLVHRSRARVLDASVLVSGKKISYARRMRFTTLLFFLLCVTAHAQTRVVGENYIARVNDDALEVNLVNINSWALERNTCHVWAEQSSRWDFRDADTSTVPFAGRLVSDVENGSVLVTNGTQLQRRSIPTGELVADGAVENGNELQRAVYTNGHYWLLFQKQRRLWLEEWTQELSYLRSVSLVDGRDLWKAPVILSASSGLWVGFSVTSNSHAYSPVVARVDTDGKILEFFSWQEKGLLFALAVLGADVLISRDVPSSPFTLPVYSHIELLKPNSTPQPYFSAETNWFVDAMAVGQQGLWTAERSIHSGTGSRLRRHQAHPINEKVWPLPGGVRALCACP